MSELQASRLGKTFPGIVALDNVDLTVRSGTVHALVGANGAGKSTLIKLLTGYYTEYTGEIAIDGQGLRIVRPADALAHGIAVVHQEVDTVLIPSLSVAENVLLEHLADNRRAARIHWRDFRAAAHVAADRVGLRVDVTRRVEDLTLHEKQLLVIARAVSRNVRFLILDEPTASLSLHEVERLFRVIRDLAAAGVGIIYISHRLVEVGMIADEITVLRSGRHVAHFPGNVAPARIVEAMLGVAVTDLFPARNATLGEIVLQTRGLRRNGAFEDITLSVRRGEVLGVIGLVGAGKTELLRVLFGADRADGGVIAVEGREVRLRQPRDAIQHGIFLVPEERRTQGLHVDATVRENISLQFLSAFSWLSWVLRSREVRHATGVIGRVGLVPQRTEQLVSHLSGGNQQKVVIGKWLGRVPRVMLFDEPTHGIDVQAKRDVYRLVRQLSNDAGVIYASSDLDEVLGLADRVVVMRDGRIVAELPAATANRQRVLEYATGAQPQEVER